MDTVILIMKRPGNIRVMRQALTQVDIDGIGVSSEAELQAAFRAVGNVPAMIDVTGFGQAVWRMCATLQERGNPFIVLSAPKDLEAGSHSLRFGAASVLQKPVTKTAIIQLVRELVGVASDDHERDPQDLE
ncbi:MAG: response regulator [Halomonas sp.]|nr:response regulator [Halomonas sp.]